MNPDILGLWSILRWFLLAWAVILFIFAREAFFVALIGGAVGGFLGGLASSLLMDGYFLSGAILGVAPGMLIGMLASLHSHFSIGKLGRNHSPNFYKIYSVIAFPGYVLNLIQYFFQCPWRGLMKRYDSPFSRFARCGFGKFFLGLLSIINYIISFPLRLICAVYFDIFVRLLSVLTDVFLEFFIPKADGMRYKNLFLYLLLWFILLPWRFLKYIVWKSGLTIIESLFFTVYDTFIPTLTMYHGTSGDASALITSKGNWKVGSGNYAGSGIYFAIYKRTADHYQKINTDGVIIVSRVSLGRILNMSKAPKHVREMVANYGDGITDYGLKHGYRSTEWWRKDSDWWEYCMLDKGGPYDHPWRIRELYIYQADSGIKKRIYGSMASWFFN